MDYVDYGIVRIVDKACEKFRRTHTGVLSMYALWCMIGLAIIALMLR